MNQLDELFANIFSETQLIKMIFSSKRKKTTEYAKVTIRPVKLQNQVKYQVEYSFEKKVLQENLAVEDVEILCNQLISKDFKQINIFTVSEDIQVLASKPEKARISTKPATRDIPSLEHNKTKNYIIPDHKPCDFLIRLGVMDSQGNVIKKYYSKFRQINRYLEIVDDTLFCLPKDRTLKIIDFGCGKAYLTFALYYYLKILNKRNVKIIGLDLKKDVISFCNKISKDLNYDGIEFLMGDIADYTDKYADMVVTLHACDTATDYALINAVSWNSKVILSVPCCQHELFSQIKNDIHNPILKYGILKDRLTEYLTDGLRGLKLESKGYDVSMIEFTSLEHTSRNIMIKAVHNSSTSEDKKEKALKEYEQLCTFYQVHPTIDKL